MMSKPIRLNVNGVKLHARFSRLVFDALDRMERSRFYRCFLRAAHTFEPRIIRCIPSHANIWPRSSHRPKPRDRGTHRDHN